MCKTAPGKYIVNGEEILIDNLDELSKEVAETLEQNPMNQLDAYYIRKNIHHISKIFAELSVSIEDRINNLNNRIKKQEEALQEALLRDLDCKAKEIPTIATKVVHEIVNGKFGNISTELKDIKTNQSNASTILSVYKEEQSLLHSALMNKLDYVSNRTIFGWIKHNFETKPLRTSIVAGLISVLTFLYIMASLRISSFTDMYNFIKHWIQ